MNFPANTATCSLFPNDGRPGRLSNDRSRRPDNLDLPRPISHRRHIPHDNPPSQSQERPQVRHERHALWVLHGSDNNLHNAISLEHTSDQRIYRDRCSGLRLCRCPPTLRHQPHLRATGLKGFTSTMGLGEMAVYRFQAVLCFNRFTTDSTHCWYCAILLHALPQY